jgi:glycosyltransferase involved in cell wall biosynthesis
MSGFLSLQKTKIFALSQGIANIYIKNGFDPNRVKVVPNGVRDDLFDFNAVAAFDKSICLGKIEYRKRQHLIKDIPNIDFVGKPIDGYPYLVKNIGAWDKPTLYKNLTNYSNLVLLSDGEAHPLVCLEALSAGLGLVLSKYAIANLDTSKPFINVISEEMINNVNFINYTLEENRRVSREMRQEIRDYAISNFSWEKIVKDIYLPCINQ